MSKDWRKECCVRFYEILRGAVFVCGGLFTFSTRKYFEVPAAWFHTTRDFLADIFNLWYFR